MPGEGHLFSPLGIAPRRSTDVLAIEDADLVKAVRFIREHACEGIDVAEVARRVGLSRTRFAETFRHYLGESPMAYLGKWRLRLGAEMLQTTADSVAEVAVTVGYGSEAAFNRAFKREFDCPPAQFRRRKARSAS
jgi:transcriptional regulator GlxA family with amidase domain